MSPAAAILITILLALLLIIYVFSGGKSDKGTETVERTAEDPAARCSSQETSDLIKRELFRRALAVRGGDPTAFAQVANYSSVRMSSATMLGQDEGSGTVTCGGSVALDLPPGVEVEGGRRTLAADVEYTVRTGANGRDQLGSLSDADAIVTPLASLGQPGGAGALAPPPKVKENATSAEAPPPAAAPAEERRPAAAPAPREAAKPRPPERRTATATPPRRPAATKPASPAASQPAAAAPVAAARPSFNCRYARTRGEIAVCGDPGLASLDRQMSAQFYRALSVARPGQRALLQKSRNRFLSYRDSCGSQACIADAYRGRMREISDIMTGGY